MPTTAILYGYNPTGAMKLHTISPIAFALAALLVGSASGAGAQRHPATPLVVASLADARSAPHPTPGSESVFVAAPVVLDEGAGGAGAGGERRTLRTTWYVEAEGSVRAAELELPLMLTPDGSVGVRLAPPGEGAPDRATWLPMHPAAAVNHRSAGSEIILSAASARRAHRGLEIMVTYLPD